MGNGVIFCCFIFFKRLLLNCRVTSFRGVWLTFNREYTANAIQRASVNVNKLPGIRKTNDRRADAII